MFKFFRRLKSDRSENNHEKNSKHKSKKDEQNLSTLGNSSDDNACAAVIPPSNNVINKAQVVEDQVDRKRSHLKNVDTVYVDENVDHRYTKEKSSRNEIVDLTRNDRTSQCRNQNDRTQSKSIDHRNQPKQQQEKYPSDPQPSSSFNPINKSRDFLYEIMGKNRNRNRNRNKNKHNKSDDRIVVIQDADKQATSNEITQEECGRNQQNSETDADEARNKQIHKSLESKNDIQNFGYQITKSQNRTNLIMKYEGEDEDNNENIEQKSDSDRDGRIECGGCSNPIAEDQLNCADASSDVKLCENRNLEHEESRETNSSKSQAQEEVIIIGDLNLHTDQCDSQSNDHKTWNPLDNSIDKLVSGPQIDELEQILELTECDRDQQYQFATSINMGQDNSKNSLHTNASGDISSDHVHNNIVIPTITVADYSDQDVNKNKSNNTSNTIDSDIFYDTESFDNIHHLKIHQNADTDDWHFVACESDQVIIEDDPDTICDGAYNTFDIPTTVNDTNKILHDESNVFRRNSFPASENLSNTSSVSNLIDGKHHTDSPDSGIELLDDNRILASASDHLLPINRESELFARDSSTDCDDNYLLHSDNDPDDHDNRQQYHQHKKDKHKHIVIDSISLPDVVVESTSSMGNSNSIKTVEHIEDHRSSTIILTDHNDNETRDLVNQEARYSVQLEEAQKVIFSTQTKVNELQSKIDSLEKELSIKSWNVDRLQSELLAAHKEDDCVRRRLNLLQDELGKLKQKYSENEDDLNRRYDELETQHTELQEKYQQTKGLASTLQTQLAFAQSDTEQCRLEKQKLCMEKDEELKNLEDALENSQEDRKKLEEKWQMEFELLRTQNSDRQEHLLSDCEWQLRTMQKTCKEKVDAAQKAKNEALQKATEISFKATEQLEQLSHIVPLKAEVRQLRGLTNDQRESLMAMTHQLHELRCDLEDANKQLEEEVNNVRKIRLHCDNALSDKERQMLRTLEEARGIVAVQWENRLLEEMTRLKNELESVHVDDRRDALDKLQIEHIEEIKVLTCRYDSNEEELRTEIETLNELLEEKSETLSNLKTKTDAALLQTRMHLDRADTEYQCAMNREMEKKEQLTERLQSEFAKEKLEMEERFRERLGHVKDEFAKELVNTTEEMASKHRKQLEQQWEKLVSEKEEALQMMENRNRIRLEEADNRIKDIEIQHQRDLKEIRTNFEIERISLESRDLSNSQEIEQLHRKCRCLTNLFEEMRMRYERRDPRPEDLRDVAELRERCESQERDLQLLTERLREIQIERENHESQQQQRKGKAARKPVPKNIPTNCDVIYEENEERESPHKDTKGNSEELDSRSETEDEESEYSESSEIVAVES